MTRAITDSRYYEKVRGGGGTAEKPCIPFGAAHTYIAHIRESPLSRVLVPYAYLQTRSDVSSEHIIL